MPLTYKLKCTNPSNRKLPAVPIPTGAVQLIPDHDHLFGDVIDAINTALQKIFGGTTLWKTRMEYFNPVLATIWCGLGNVDLGHSNGSDISTARTIGSEIDEHAHMFGYYAARLQWHLCEIVCTACDNKECTNYGRGNEHMISGATRAWKKNVLTSYDDVIENLVDSTALDFYIKTPDGKRKTAVNIRHPTISLAAARAYVNANGTHRGATARVNQVLDRFVSLRGTFEGFLERFDGSTKTFNGIDKWI